MLPIDFFDNDIEKLNSIILDDNLLKEKIEEYYNSCQNWECSILEPYRGKILNKLFSLGLIPKFVRGRKIPQILNHVECESHRDKLIYALRKRLK
jgi:poly-gamma-glutamate synthesis protein (capsule biosynthesis protein)